MEAKEENRNITDSKIFRNNGARMNTQAERLDPDCSAIYPGFSPDLQPSRWLTAAEAAAYLNFKTRTILLWARQGRIKAYALTGTRRRTWRFLLSDLDALTAQKKPVVSSPQPSVLANERRL
jgi:excisionase family DNA binding protein